MPRKSAAATNVVAIDSKQVRLRPPTDMPPSERDLFARLVACNAPGHFKDSDMPLLTQYVSAAVLGERAIAELRRAPLNDEGRPSAWLAVFEKANKACVSLSMRLRLSPQARAPHTNTAKPRREPPLSAYEAMRLSNVDDQ
jgi:hypothetical protein